MLADEETHAMRTDDQGKSSGSESDENDKEDEEDGDKENRVHTEYPRDE